MPKFLYSFLVILLVNITTVFTQNTGTISGQIKLIDGQPFASAPVSIIELNKSTLTDGKGNYSFKNIPPATYHIMIQALGAAEQIIETTDFRRNCNGRLPASTRKRDGFARSNCFRNC